MKNRFFLILLVSILTSIVVSVPLGCSSKTPDILNVDNEGNTSIFTATYAGDTMLTQSVLGLEVNETNFTENVTVTGFTENEFDETWTTINGKQPTVRNHYNEYRFKISKPDAVQQYYEIIFRLYDKGFAYRYIFP